MPDDTLDDAVPARPNAARSASAVDTSNISTLLQHHREVQDNLTDDLAAMARQLRLNASTFNDSLEADKAAIELAEMNLGSNLGTMQKERGRLGKYEKKGGWTTCYVVMAVAGVAASWTFMFLLIRIT